jgi:hypothetical protein
MARPKFSKIITSKQIQRFKVIVIKFLKRTTKTSIPAVARDADDNYLLGICACCRAEFLITGDQDFLVIKQYQKTKIVTMSQFLTVAVP